jgi:CBS-domain-containing membrane protein
MSTVASRSALILPRVNWSEFENQSTLDVSVNHLTVHRYSTEKDHSMPTTLKSSAEDRLVLNAATAADLMSRDPVSIRQSATIKEAAAFLIERDISAAPVIDEAGRPVGVISSTDIVRHNGAIQGATPSTSDYYSVANLLCPPALRNMVHAKKSEHVQVRDIMTPTLLSVSPEDSVITVISNLLAMKVHRLFVIDASGVLVGVISTFDVLSKLRKQ